LFQEDLFQRNFNLSFTSLYFL